MRAPATNFIDSSEKPPFLGRLFCFCGHGKDAGDIAVQVYRDRLAAFVLYRIEHDLFDQVADQRCRFRAVIFICERLVERGYPKAAIRDGLEDALSGDHD